MTRRHDLPAPPWHAPLTRRVGRIRAGAPTIVALAAAIGAIGAGAHGLAPPPPARPPAVVATAAPTAAAAATGTTTAVVASPAAAPNAAPAAPARADPQARGGADGPRGHDRAS